MVYDDEVETLDRVQEKKEEREGTTSNGVDGPDWESSERMQAGYGIPGEPLEGLLLAGSLMDAAWLLKKIQLVRSFVSCRESSERERALHEIDR
ncbi:hypothetical protein V1478_009550 [Vespula squamosa]|uniref:Uncharacterized protein n=1 Tax=Vespula squamosa TaxID=30214 RepID=A0ABD2APZ3_VESSQ